VVVSPDFRPRHPRALLTGSGDTAVRGVAVKVIADICVVPITGRVSVRREVARAHQILRDTGLPVHLHAYGTNIEGEFGEVMAALERIHEELHAAGVPRISTTIRLGTRTDKEQSLLDKVQAVEASLAGSTGSGPGLGDNR
jgi:uncharacterized protein (TIGR00106 family)